MSVTTGKVRLSYCHIWEPYAADPGADPRYSVTILIPKTDTVTLNAIHGEMAAAEQRGITEKWGGTKPPVVKTPLYDGDGVRPSGEPFGEECRGHMVMTASSRDQPAVVDLQVRPVLSRSEVYSGCYARVSLDFFAYAQSGNRGIGCGLNAVQKISDGEALAGRVSAQEAFGGANAYTGAAQYQTPVQQPYAQPAPYQTPVQQPYAPAATDPITGQPLMTGGVMGMG